MITWKPEKRKIADLVHWEENPRKISDKGAQKLRERIEARGFHDVIKIDTDNTILSGNMRKDVLESMGMEEVNVLVPERELTVEERVLVGLESNMNDGEWDDDNLEIFGEDALELAGFDDKEIDNVFRKKVRDDDEFDPDEAELSINAKTKIGNVYALGDHRLLCADSTKLESYRTLMGDEIASMIFCDPPYNIDYQGGMNAHGKNTREKIDNDKMSKSQFADFLRAFIACSMQFCGGVWYICMSSKEIDSLKRVFESEGGHWQSFIIWVKHTFTLSRSDWQNQYEPILYGWGTHVKNHYFVGMRDEANVWEDVTAVKPSFKDGKTTMKLGDYQLELDGKVTGKIIRKKDQTDIWREKKPTRSIEHPTMKPVALVERAIIASSRRGEIVLDQFLGAGTTIIAAENTGRICYGMEISPRYCDVIVKRWEEKTGRKAELLNQ